MVILHRCQQFRDQTLYLGPDSGMTPESRPAQYLPGLQAQRNTTDYGHIALIQGSASGMTLAHNLLHLIIKAAFNVVRSP
jgi:hypothetical protein